MEALNMLASELLAKYKECQRDFVSVKLEDSDLTNANLQGINLRDANLSGICLWCADLTGSDLTNADLTGADLTGAALNGANLSGANLSDAYLTGVDLQGANLQGARIGEGKVIKGYFKRTRSIIGDIQIAYNDTEIWINRRSSGWLTPDELLAQNISANDLRAERFHIAVQQIIEVVALERKNK
jgi:hypothetical protein